MVFFIDRDAIFSQNNLFLITFLQFRHTGREGEETCFCNCSNFDNGRKTNAGKFSYRLILKKSRQMLYIYLIPGSHSQSGCFMFPWPVVSWSILVPTHPPTHPSPPPTHPSPPTQIVSQMSRAN